MSVDIGIYKLNWKEFLDAHRNAKSTEFMLESPDEQPPYVRSFGADFYDSYAAATDAADWIEFAIKTAGPLPGLADLASLFSENRGRAFVGVKPKGKLAYVFKVYSPEHVKKLSTSIGKIDWDKFKTLLEAEDGDWQDRFSSPKELVSYLKEWATFVEEASSKKRGLYLRCG